MAKGAMNDAEISKAGDEIQVRRVAVGGKLCADTDTDSDTTGKDTRPRGRRQASKGVHRPGVVHSSVGRRKRTRRIGTMRAVPGTDRSLRNELARHWKAAIETSRDEMSMMARARRTSSVPGRLMEARRTGRARSTVVSRGQQGLARGTSIRQGWTYRRSGSGAGRLTVAQFDRTTAARRFMTRRKGGDANSVCPVDGAWEFCADTKIYSVGDVCDARETRNA